jgi:hypothetical protein
MVRPNGKNMKPFSPREADLAGRLGNRDGIEIERQRTRWTNPSAGERAAIRNLQRESNLLRKVRSALARIAGETYGACLHCERKSKQSGSPRRHGPASNARTQPTARSSRRPEELNGLLADAA